MLTYASTVVLKPTEDAIRDDSALQTLITSNAAYVGPGVGPDDLRANNAAKVFLSICLGLQAAGVLSIQHVPALWIDIGEKAYKISLQAEGDGEASDDGQALDLSFSESDEIRVDTSDPLKSRDRRCTQLRSETTRNQHMAGFLKGIEILVQCTDFSITPPFSENALENSMPSKMIEEPLMSGIQVNDPIRQVVLQLQWLDQLEKQADKLSLYTNKAYYSVGEAYRNAVETTADGLHSSSTARNQQRDILRRLAAYAGLEHLTSPHGRAALSKRMQRAHKFCLVVEIFGIDILQAVPAVSVSRLEKITFGKLLEVRDGGLYKEEVERIQLRLVQLNALRASIFNID